MAKSNANKGTLKGATGRGHVSVPKKLITQFNKTFKQMVALEKSFANI